VREQQRVRGCQRCKYGVSDAAMHCDDGNSAALAVVGCRGPGLVTCLHVLEVAEQLALVIFRPWRRRVPLLRRIPVACAPDAA
jgi:threonine/homoserine efflux transporter RhtA